MTFWWGVGFAALVVVLSLQWKRIVALFVRWRLGPYRSLHNPQPAGPASLTSPKRVAVVGGGLAGIAAASTLAKRGYAVTVFEANNYLGGKIGSWQVELAPGVTEWVSHGFHGFFRHYYNLNHFLRELGVHQQFRSIGDYRILLPGGDAISFGALETTPVLNLLSMARNGIYRLRDVVGSPKRDLLSLFLEYDEQRTFQLLDGVSFAQFDSVARLPPKLKRAFNTFARAFFADETKLSMAELVKSFHFYYLSHDGGLVYDYPTSDYERALLAPIRQHFEALGIVLKLSTPVSLLEKDGPTFRVDGERFDKVVVAVDAPAARRIFEAAKGFEGIDSRLLSLNAGQRYAVVRLWLEGAPRDSLPVFVTTDRDGILDAITFCDRAEVESADWVKRHGGSVIELHCYAVPDALEEAAIEHAMVKDMKRFLPELQEVAIRYRHTQIRRNFTAFHVGMGASRPPTDTGVDGCVCAGDWVKLPFPAMLLEAAFASGIVAANHLLRAHGLQEAPVWTVPLRGIFAGVPHGPQKSAAIQQIAQAPKDGGRA